MRNRSKQVVYLVLSLATLLTGYVYLRYAYQVTDSTPFTQEIVLTILGTVATIFITALLLNKQTAVEIEKEQNIKYLELKTNTYEKLLDLLQEMSLLDKFTNAELVKMQFLTHRLAIIASPEVLHEYQSFLDVISRISSDSSFSGDTNQLHEALAKLTIQIRRDLIADDPRSSFTQKQIGHMITSNSSESAEIIGDE